MCYLDTELCFGKLVHSEKKRSMITSLTMYGVTKIQKQGSTPGRLSALRVPSLADIKTLDTELWVVQFEFTTEFFFEIDSYLSQAGIELTVQPRRVLHFKSFCLHFLSASITGVGYYTQFMWCWALNSEFNS